MVTSREIEREVENQRASVESTLEALKSKMSMGQIVDELGGYVGKDDAKHALRNVGRQVRDNPVAFGLVGVGLAWLMMGSGSRGSSRDVDWEDRRYAAPVGGGTPYGGTGGHAEGAAPGMSGDRRYGSAFGTPYQGAPGGGYSGGYSGEGYARSGGGSSGGGVLSKVASAVGGAASAVTGAASAAGGALSSAGGALASAGGAIASAGSTAAEKLASAGGAVTGAVSGAGERVRHVTDAGGRTISGVSQEFGARRRQAGDTLMETLERQPLLVGGFALVVGVAIGAALPATRTEDRLLGEQRDDLIDEAKRAVVDLKDQAVDAAKAGIQAAGRAAEEEGLTPSAEGKTLAAKVETVVRAAVEEARHNLEESDAAANPTPS